MDELCIGIPKVSADPIASHRRGRRNEKKRLIQIPLRDGPSMSRSLDSLPPRHDLNIVANQVLGSREHDMILEAQFVKSLERAYIPPQFTDKRDSSNDSVMSMPSVRPSDVLQPWSKINNNGQEPEHHLTFLEAHRDESDAISELSGMESTNSMFSQMSFVSAGGRRHTRQPAKHKSAPKPHVHLSHKEVMDNLEKDRETALKAYFDCISEIYSIPSLQFDLDHVGTIHKDLSTNEGNVKHTIKARILMKQLLSELKGIEQYQYIVYLTCLLRYCGNLYSQGIASFDIHNC